MRLLFLMINKDNDVSGEGNSSLLFITVLFLWWLRKLLKGTNVFSQLHSYWLLVSGHNSYNVTATIQVAADINFSFRRHGKGLTFLGERNLSRDGVNGEHLAWWNPGHLFQEAEAQLGVDGAALVSIQSLDLHERDPCDTRGGSQSWKKIAQRVNHILLTRLFFISIHAAPLKVLLPLRSPSWTLPRMLSPIKVGTLSFLSMTHTSTVKLWRLTGVLKDTCTARSHTLTC